MNIYPTILLFAVTAVSVGCTQKWGNLPPHQYSGVVINEISKKPIDGADVSIRRSGFKFSMWPTVASEILASTETASDGSFDVSTDNGYAQWIYVSAHRKYGAFTDVPQGDANNLVIKVRPIISTIDSRIYERSESDKRYELSGCVEKIIDFHERDEGSYLSMDEYLNLSVITHSQHQFVKENFDLFSFPTEPGFSKVFVSWGDELFVLKSMSLPIEFSTVPEDFYYPPRKVEVGALRQ